MLLKTLFNTSHVEEFAKSLASDFSARFPATQGREAKKGADKKLAAAIQHVNQRARQFNQEQKIGIYKKAKLSNTLKWELKELGYEDDLIDELIKGMLFAMAQKAR